MVHLQDSQSVLQEEVSKMSEVIEQRNKEIGELTRLLDIVDSDTTEKTPKQVKKLPPPPKEIEPSYSYESQDTESIEPWQPPMGMQRPQMQGKQLQLPKPKQSFQFKPIQVKDSSEY